MTKICSWCINFYFSNHYRLAGKNIEKGYGQVELRHYFLILDGVFMVNGNLQSNLQKTLKEYYPVLKVIRLLPSNLKCGIL